MDPSQLFVTLKPILGDISKYQQPSITTAPSSNKWNHCRASLDKLIAILSDFPSIITTDHPIPNFCSSVSLTIPSSYSSESIANFNCVPYFIYSNYRQHPRTKVLNHFCKLSPLIFVTFDHASKYIVGLIFVPLSQFISTWYSSEGQTLKDSPPESVIIRQLMCWKLVFLKCEKLIDKSNDVNHSKSNVIKDIFFKLMHFTFPMPSSSLKSEKQQPFFIKQSEEIMFHTINVWIAFFLNVFPNDYLYKTLFMSKQLRPAFGYIISNILDILRNEDGFVRSTTLKMHCIYLLVIICQFLSRHCTDSCPLSIVSMLNDCKSKKNASFVEMYEENLLNDLTDNEEMNQMKKCDGDGLEMLGSFIPGIIGNLMTVIDAHYNNHSVKSKIISVAISALIYVIHLTVNPIQKDQKRIFAKWKAQNMQNENEEDDADDMNCVNLQALLSLTEQTKSKPIEKTQKIETNARQESNETMQQRDSSWLGTVRSKLSIIFGNLFSVIFIDKEQGDNEHQMKVFDEFKAINWSQNGPKFASFFQHSRVRLSLILSSVRILIYIGPIIEYDAMLNILEFLMTQCKISLYSIDPNHICSKLIESVLQQYIFGTLNDAKGGTSNICNALTERLLDLLRSLPRLCKLQNDEKSLLNLKLIYGYLHILSPFYKKQSIVSVILNDCNDNMVINNLLYCLSIHCNGSLGFGQYQNGLLSDNFVSSHHLIFESHSNILSPATVLKYDQLIDNDFTNRNFVPFEPQMKMDDIPLFYEMNLAYFQNEECRTMIYKICQKIGYITIKSANPKRIVFKFRQIVDPLLEFMENAQQKTEGKRKQIQILLFVYNLLIGAAKYCYKSGIFHCDEHKFLKKEFYSYCHHLIDTLMQSQYFELALSNHSTLIKYLYQSKGRKNKKNSSKDRNTQKKIDFDEAQLKVFGAKELSQNSIIIALILRIFSSISYMFLDRNYFDRYLMLILYPMIEKLSMSENDLVHQTALSAMHHIAYSNRYQSFDDFIISNSDYIIDRISKNLNYSISRSYFSFNPVSDSFDAFNSRTPQILQALLSHTKSPSIVMPLLFDTIDHILNSLDSLSRNTRSKIEHNALSTSSMFSGEETKLKLDWKPSMTMTSALILSEKNKDFQSSIWRKLKIEDGQSKNTKMTSNDIEFVKDKMKQTWQLKCIHEYMQTLHCIVKTLSAKHIASPPFIDNEESKTFDCYLSYQQTPDYNIDDGENILFELDNYKNLLDGNLPHNGFDENEVIDLNDWKKAEVKENKGKLDEEEEPFWRKRPDQPSSEESIVENIMKRCMHFVSSKVGQTKYLSLCIVEECIFCLSFRKKLLLPITATFWKSFCFVLRESDKSIVLKSYDVLLVICNHCGGFIKRRFENDVWPSMKHNIKKNWTAIKERLSSTDLEQTVEVKIIDQILQCLVSLLNVSSGNETAIDKKLRVRDRETVKIMFANLANEIVSELIPLLNDIGTPIGLIQSVTKVMVLFAEVIDKEMIWFNLFVLNPHFMAKYYQQPQIKLKDSELLNLQQFVTDNVETVRKENNFNLYLQKLIKLIDET